ncbi:DUF6124 family protein [Pseudomonas chlororaphis]|uniref:DUF3077 domain-containing protein n=1 Tax=Pseudomonas chlororaphis TaxID=587753 RepID=A0A1Q8EMY3_9PSED|nr:DUF3077 domain-containing protein [Pseudomonas chlororaphis]OLF53119.1 DUF3077 domain-containing protein [Pseudomonas chlororaphis]
MNSISKDAPELETDLDFGALKDSEAARRAMDYYLKPVVSESALDEKFFEIKHNISGEEAMIHASDLLRCAAASAYEAADHLRGTRRDLAFSVVHMIDMAKALVDRSLDSHRQE